MCGITELTSGDVFIESTGDIVKESKGRVIENRWEIFE